MFKIENDLIANPSGLWAYFNKMKQSSRIPGTIFYLDSQFEHQQQILNIIANYYESVFRPPRGLDAQDLSRDSISSGYRFCSRLCAKGLCHDFNCAFDSNL